MVLRRHSRHFYRTKSDLGMNGLWYSVIMKHFIQFCLFKDRVLSELDKAWSTLCHILLRLTIEYCSRRKGLYYGTPWYLGFISNFVFLHSFNRILRKCLACSKPYYYLTKIYCWIPLQSYKKIHVLWYTLIFGPFVQKDFISASYILWHLNKGLAYAVLYYYLGKTDCWIPLKKEMTLTQIKDTGFQKDFS